MYEACENPPRAGRGTRFLFLQTVSASLTPHIPIVTPCLVAVDSNKNQEFRLRTPGTASKAMRLLGLSALPTDALPVEHPSTRRRSFQCQSRSPSPPTTTLVHRDDFFLETHLREPLRNSVSGVRPGEVGDYALSIAETESSSESEEYGRVTQAERESRGEADLDCSRTQRSQSHCQPHIGAHRSERSLLRRHSSLSLCEADMDHDFVGAVADLMAQFPEPPSCCTPTDSASAGESYLASPLSTPTPCSKGKKTDWRPSSHASRLHMVWKGQRQEHQPHQPHQRRLSQLHRRRESRGTVEIDDPLRPTCTAGDLVSM